MKKILALSASAAFAVLLSPGLASADNEYVGSTYAKAAEDISRYGKAIIVSRIGDYLPTEECIVVGSRTGNFNDSSGNVRGGTVLLNLNCNDSVAGAHAGNSAATPEGKKAQLLRKYASDISEDYAKSEADGQSPYCADNFDTCVSICKKTGKCSSELSDYLGI